MLRELFVRLWFLQKVMLTQQQCMSFWDKTPQGGICVRYKLEDGMLEWLDENCSFYKIFVEWNEIYFLKNADAILFKLTWG